jgi:hypothetical protein
MEELSQRKGSNEDKMKMMEILKRTNEQEESGNESDESNQEDVSLEQRLAGIDLGDYDIMPGGMDSFLYRLL